MGLCLRSERAANRMENDECILCATCVDNCAQDEIRNGFSAGT